MTTTPVVKTPKPKPTACTPDTNLLRLLLIRPDVAKALEGKPYKLTNVHLRCDPQTRRGTYGWHFTVTVVLTCQDHAEKCPWTRPCCPGSFPGREFPLRRDLVSDGSSWARDNTALHSVTWAVLVPKPSQIPLLPPAHDDVMATLLWEAVLIKADAMAAALVTESVRWQQEQKDRQANEQTSLRVANVSQQVIRVLHQQAKAQVNWGTRLEALQTEFRAARAELLTGVLAEAEEALKGKEEPAVVAAVLSEVRREVTAGNAAAAAYVKPPEDTQSTFDLLASP